MWGALQNLARDQHASPAAETAIALPILFALIFAPMELGNYFLSEHKVVKAVRDGARYAARRPFTDFVGCTPSTDVVDETRNVTRTGIVATGGTPRVSAWTDPASISVTATCDSSGTYTGIYANPSAPGVPVVTVSANVPYTPVLGQLGLTSTTLTLQASSEAAVTGI